MPDLLCLKMEKLNFSPSNFYRRHLPHWQPTGAEYFVTFRLKDTLPESVIKKLKEEQSVINNKAIAYREFTGDEIERKKKIFKRFDKVLDSAEYGPTWLKKGELAQIVEDSIFFFEQKEYDLYAFTIMPNHVHLVFKHIEGDTNDVDFPVTSVIGRLKSFTANECNKKLKRSGTFWQDESYDHVIRDNDELERIIKYVLHNPVKTGLADNWKEWEFTYCKKEFLVYFK